MLNVLRQAVNPSVRRYKDQKYNLDLSYITPHLIASAMPTSARLQSCCSMSSAELNAFLSERHGSNWQIWSLQEDSELAYTPSDFENRVIRHPIPDHAPPPFLELLQIAQEIRHFLEENQRNVALVHCKYGRGRTGTIVIAYLMLYHGMTYSQAQDIFTKKRQRHGFGNGVTILSQQRFLGYVASWISAGHPREPLAMVAMPTAVRISRMLVRNPHCDNLEFAVSDAKSGGLSQDRWDVVRMPSAEGADLCLRPLGEIVLHSPDIRVVVTANWIVQGCKIPHGASAIAFNTAIESGAFSQPDIQRHIASPATLSQDTLFSPPVSAPQFGDKGYFSFGWKQTDGLWGTSIRGTQMFDSIVLYWTTIEATQTTVNISDDPYPNPPSLSPEV